MLTLPQLPTERTRSERFARVLTRVLAGTRLRVGFRLVSTPGYDIRIGTQENGNPVTLHLL